MRLPFLLLTPICVLLGSGFVYYQGISLDTSLLALVLVGAILSHISVNMINEYLDFTSGLDLHTQRTRFSGGSGALPENPVMALPVLYGGVIAMLMAVVIGSYFIWHAGKAILPIGIVGILIIISYTRWLNRSPLLCLTAPGMGFGVLMVLGTTIVLSGQLLPGAWLVTICPFMLVNNLLLLNQLPDIEADRNAGRRHLPITHGVKTSMLVYTLFATSAYLSVIYAVVFQHLPGLSLLCLLTIPLALFAIQGGNRYGKNIGTKPQHLAANVAVSLVTPALVAISLFLA